MSISPDFGHCPYRLSSAGIIQNAGRNPFQCQFGHRHNHNPFLVNTVVGFIGPEYIYDTKELIRAPKCRRATIRWCPTSTVLECRPSKPPPILRNRFRKCCAKKQAAYTSSCEASRFFKDVGRYFFFFIRTFSSLCAPMRRSDTGFSANI